MMGDGSGWLGWDWFAGLCVIGVRMRVMVDWHAQLNRVVGVKSDLVKEERADLSMMLWTSIYSLPYDHAMFANVE